MRINCLKHLPDNVQQFMEGSPYGLDQTVHTFAQVQLGEPYVMGKRVSKVHFSPFTFESKKEEPVVGVKMHFKTSVFDRGPLPGLEFECTFYNKKFVHIKLPAHIFGSICFRPPQGMDPTAKLANLCISSMRTALGRENETPAIDLEALGLAYH